MRAIIVATILAVGVGCDEHRQTHVMAMAKLKQRGASVPDGSIAITNGDYVCTATVTNYGGIYPELRCIITNTKASSQTPLVPTFAYFCDVDLIDAETGKSVSRTSTYAARELGLYFDDLDTPLKEKKGSYVSNGPTAVTRQGRDILCMPDGIPVRREIPLRDYFNIEQSGKYVFGMRFQFYTGDSVLHDFDVTKWQLHRFEGSLIADIAIRSSR